MKKTEYAIHEDFKVLSKVNVPLNSFTLPLFQGMTKMLWNLEKTNKILEVKKLRIPFGNEKVKAILYSPKSVQPNAPCLIYYHGGGFVFPPAPHHFYCLKEYAKRLNCKVMLVAYPLAPKYKYPIPVNACFECYLWLLENCEKYSIDKNKIAIGGDSAGGNLASVVTMMAQEKKVTKPCCQLLIYPAVGSSKKTESMKKYTDTPICNSKDYDRYCKFYFDLSNTTLSKIKPQKYLSPMKAKDFTIFPPTYIETAEFDCLRDEALLYADELNKAKVKTIINNTKGTIHAYDMVIKSSITQDSINKRVEFLREYLFK